MKNDTVKINFGGEGLIKVNYETLVKIPESKLAKTFTAEITLQKDGSVYLDRNFDNFSRMIDFLRNDMNQPNFASSA